MEIQELYNIYKNHSSVCTDSRKVTEDCIFFALKGERFDGNKYASLALDQGAAYAVVDDEEICTSAKYLLVSDVLQTLQALATFHRQQFYIPLLAVTGSNGKTTTKELISAVLDTQYHVHYTKGNFNNHIGVPLTLLQMPKETEVAVIEMGANHQGEIKQLCEIAEPTHGLITNVGKAHLEGFGGFEGVKKGKGELYDYLAENRGTSFINTNEDHLLEMATHVSYQLHYTTCDEPHPSHSTFEIKLLEVEPYVKVAFLDKKAALLDANTNLVGQYNLNNIMSAVEVGRYFKIKPHNIKKALEAYIPENNRSQIIKQGTLTYILDAYNANPTSMKAALANLQQMPQLYKIAILGDMLELGVYSDTEHKTIVELAKDVNLKQLVLVGTHFKKVAEETNTLHFDKVEQAKEWFDQQTFADACILIKGSRGIKLEKLL